MVCACIACLLMWQGKYDTKRHQEPRQSRRLSPHRVLVGSRVLTPLGRARAQPKPTRGTSCGKTRPSSRNTLTTWSRTLLRQQQRRTRGFQTEDGLPPTSSESGLPWLSSSFATSSQKSALSARWARGAQFIAGPHLSRGIAVKMRRFDWLKWIHNRINWFLKPVIGSRRKNVPQILPRGVLIIGRK